MHCHMGPSNCPHDSFSSPLQLAEELITEGINHRAAERELERRGPGAEGYVSAAPDVPLSGSPRSGAAGLAI